MNCFKRAYMCRASRRPLQHLIPPSTSFPQIQETAVQLLLYHKDVGSLADFPRRPSSPLIARVFPPFLYFPAVSVGRCLQVVQVDVAATHCGWRSRALIYLFTYSSYIYATLSKTSRCYGYIVDSIRRLSDYGCYLFLFHPYLHQTAVFYLSPLPSPPSVPPSLPDTVCVSRCV